MSPPLTIQESLGTIRLCFSVSVLYITVSNCPAYSRFLVKFIMNLKVGPSKLKARILHIQPQFLV
jgi:hypothetical protein